MGRSEQNFAPIESSQRALSMTTPLNRALRSCNRMPDAFGRHICHQDFDIRVSLRVRSIEYENLGFDFFMTFPCINLTYASISPQVLQRSWVQS